MSENILLDNDIVLKVCAYRCHEELMVTMTLDAQPPSMLRIGQYTLRSRLSKPCGVADRESTSAILESLLTRIKLLDPTPDEIAFAADLEEQAAAHGHEFDTGESQLVAILLSREAKLLVTADKRAIAALNEMSLTEVRGRIACLEQLVVVLLAKYPHEPVRLRVCSEPGADKAVTACFACSAETKSAEDILAGLTSYINHLRSKTGEVLVNDVRLLAVVS